VSEVLTGCQRIGGQHNICQMAMHVANANDGKQICQDSVCCLNVICHTVLFGLWFICHDAELDDVSTFLTVSLKRNLLLQC